MKKIFIAALLCAVASSLKAQNNTFPTNGNVGIRDTTPASALSNTSTLPTDNNGYTVHPLGISWRLNGGANDLYSMSLENYGPYGNGLFIKNNSAGHRFLNIVDGSNNVQFYVGDGKIYSGGDLQSVGKFVMGQDLAALPISNAESMISTYHGLLLVGQRGASFNGPISSIGNYANVAVPVQDSSKLGFLVRGASGQLKDIFQVQNNSNNALFKITALGNVGIGTITPTGNFEVANKGANDTARVRMSFENAMVGSNGTLVPKLEFISSKTVGFAPKSAAASISFKNYNFIITPGPLTGSGLPLGGKVGIGTSSPLWSLHEQSVSGPGSIGLTGSDFVNGSAGSGFYMQTNSASSYSFLQSFNSGNSVIGNFALNPDGGNVGIGTTNPLSTLQVDDGCTKASIGDASGAALNYGTSYLGFNASRTAAGWILNADTVHNGGGVMYTSINGDMYFAPIASTGSSNQTLSDTDIKNKITFRIAADGITYAKKIKVELTNWPDYVFKSKYTLMPLSDVKSYIDKNHHLPEMPSAEQVEKNGLDLGETNKLLTKKVEELTLYLIELKLEKDKQIEALENRLKKIEQ